jgi:hypothetical protein
MAAAFPAAETGSSVREVRGFDRVELSTRGALVLTQGGTESLEIDASAADLAQIATEVSGGTLRISQVNPGPGPRGPVTYRLAMRKVAGLSTSSSGSIKAASVETDALRISISSSGPIAVDRLEARTLDVTLSSSGNCSLAGSVERQAVHLSSSGQYQAGDLASREASVNVSSSGSATVRVADRLDVVISSSGNVRYHGNPSRVTPRISSSGKLLKLD